MKKERREWTDKYGVYHFAIDCYSNARNEYEAAKCVLGRDLAREDYETERQYDHLIIEDGGTHGKYYVAYIC